MQGVCKGGLSNYMINCLQIYIYKDISVYTVTPHYSALNNSNAIVINSNQLVLTEI